MILVLNSYKYKQIFYMNDERNRMKKKKFSIPVPWKIYSCIGILFLCMGYLNGCISPVNNAAAKESTADERQDIYAEDTRLKLTGHETYEYDKDSSSNGSSSYGRINKVYDEEEIAEISHAYFDEQNRLLYVLGYSPNILGDSWSYCEENIYQRNDEKGTCRYIYFKSNSMPYRDGYYVAARYMFEVSDYQFDENDRLQRSLTYRRDVGSDPNGYSDELFFSRGYEAYYDGAYLMGELQYYDYWGTNEVGAWEYRLYQYDEQGNRILEVAVTEDEITLYAYEYQEDAGLVDVYTYLVTEDWELTCADGSTCYFRPQWESPAIKIVAEDGTVEKELFYGKAMDLGQQHYLIPEEVEKTVDDHMYTVCPGDCLWKIAYKSYGHGEYYDLIYRMNWEIIGGDENLLLPGTRLYVPEAGNAQDTNISGT